MAVLTRLVQVVSPVPELLDIFLLPDFDFHRIEDEIGRGVEHVAISSLTDTIGLRSPQSFWGAGSAGAVDAAGGAGFDEEQADRRRPVRQPHLPQLPTVFIYWLS